MTESNNPSAIRSKKEITEALLTLMKDHPYSEITVKQIVLESRLAHKTFYRNFKSKDDVLLSHIHGILQSYFDIINNARCDTLTTIFAFADRHRELLMMLDKNSMLHLPLLCMNETAPDMHRNMATEKNPFTKLFEGLDAGYLMAFNFGAMWNVISLWVHRGMTDSPETVKQMVGQYLGRIKDIAT